MNTRKILETFDTWRSAGEPMALATVFETLGSTYTKAGHRIVISRDGRCSGLISGGCLEADLAEHAAGVLRAGEAKPLTYDLRDEVDDVFGLGVGCNGLIRVFIQPLLPERDYQPFAALRRFYESGHTGRCATVIEAPAGGLAAGTTLLWGGKERLEVAGNNGDEAQLADSLSSLAAQSGERLVSIDGHRILLTDVEPIPRILILGAGLDAVPLVRMCAELGWYVDIVDHRPAYLERGDFGQADSVRLVDPRSADDMHGSKPGWDAAVVMSHHLETDAAYLQTMAPQNLRYLGVLGPPARREKLLERLETENPGLRRRLRGPVGLDIGGSGPSVIALSIVAELQSVFSA